MGMSRLSGKPRTDLQITPADITTFAGTRALVVGGTDGIGRAIARFLAGRGAAVVVVGRTFRDEGSAGITFHRADLSSMAECRRVGRALSPDIDVAFFTPGIMPAPQRQITPEGLEMDLAVSFLSRLAILNELVPRVAAGTGARTRRPRVLVMGFPGTGEAGNVDDLNSERSYLPMRA